MTRSLLLGALLATACAHQAINDSGPAAPDKPRLQTLIDAADRTPQDRGLDPGRKPLETLEFLDLAPGMRVGELGAGGGYTTELLARAVAPVGVVYAQNPKAFVEGFLKEVWPARLARPVNAQVVRLDREFEDPFPPEARDLDAVVFNAVYHDTVYLKVDREKMNRAVLAALKPGGAYFIFDNSARAGAGLGDVERLHRIEEKTVRQELEAAGFNLQKEGTFLRNPGDTREWNASPVAAGEQRGTSDRFALKFIKPKG